MTAATAVAAEVAVFLFPLFLVAAAAGVLDLASFWTEVDLGGMAGEAPRDFRLSEPPRFGLGDAESVTFCRREERGKGSVVSNGNRTTDQLQIDMPSRFFIPTLTSHKKLMDRIG